MMPTASLGGAPIAEYSAPDGAAGSNGDTAVWEGPEGTLYVHAVVEDDLLKLAIQSAEPGAEYEFWNGRKIGAATPAQISGFYHGTAEPRFAPYAIIEVELRPDQCRFDLSNHTIRVFRSA
jgi:hypothetical protein